MNKLKIYINKEILDRFKNDKINLDYVGTIIIILTCLYEKNYTLLDEVDDSNKSRRLLLLYRYLFRKELIEPADAEDDENVYYILTEKGVNLTKFILSFGEDEVEVRKESLNEVMEEESEHDSVESWIEEWILLFPEGKFYGRPLRTNTRDCLDRMKWFIEKFKFDKNHIFAATKQYIEDQIGSPEGHRYTRNSTYFICKGRGVNERISDLATACEKIKYEKDTPKQFIDRDSV